MASIFTYETEPVKVASPWSTAVPRPLDERKVGQKNQQEKNLAGMIMPDATSLTDWGITKLEAEPQDGAVEYKLHLLLRPRRTLLATSTVQKISGSYLSKSRSSGTLQDVGVYSGNSSPSLATSSQSRQHRLQHLTTQLLWRLQQSSPHHSSSKSNLLLPLLPETNIALSVSRGPGPLVRGLEESLGALYEIGVSDDGSFVGLTRDELQESLHILQAMAYSLGCGLRALRLVMVGTCQWEEKPGENAKGPGCLHNEELWVAEVLVAPHLRPHCEHVDLRNDVNAGGQVAAIDRHETVSSADGGVELLRISLTGSTTSGKSSLLGTLSTSTLDNGRGKSRLSLLKHRHEMVSGVTSSLAQELIGYQDVRQTSNISPTVAKIVNYSSGNVSSWTDIHSSSDPGRLVFLTDSAGHPKFRRTTVRGLVSWAPHWTFCCVAADDDEDSTGKVGATVSSSDVLGSTSRGTDLSRAHLELCLKLGLRMVVVITKLDLASRNGLRQTLAKVLSILKSAGRLPTLLAGTAPNPTIAESQGIPQLDEEAVRQVVESVQLNQRHTLVPIVLTSALTGAGIGQVHALLCQISIPQTTTIDINKSFADKEGESRPMPIFHVDEIFGVAESSKSKGAHGRNAGTRFILSGYLRYGSIQADDSLLLGPFYTENPPEQSRTQATPRSKSFPGLSKSLPKDLTAFVGDRDRDRSQLVISPHRQRRQLETVPTWHSIKVTSLRYLRLPVRKLSKGQVGTVAISASTNLFLNAEPTLRRGMILCSPLASGNPPPAYARITAVFAHPNIYVNPGSSVTVYTASIRAPAKIVEVKIPDRPSGGQDMRTGDGFAFDDDHNDDDDDDETFDGRLENSDNSLLDATPKLKEIEITFQFTNSREWVEMGTKALVTPASGISMLNPPSSSNDGVGDGGSGAGSGAAAGLDGFVGRIVGGSC